jgi:hypothetical protein
MAAFLTSFVIFFGILFGMSGLNMDNIVDWVNYSHNAHMLQVSYDNDDGLVRVPYTCQVDFDAPNPFADCDHDVRWLKIGKLN